MSDDEKVEFELDVKERKLEKDGRASITVEHPEGTDGVKIKILLPAGAGEFLPPNKSKIGVRIEGE